MKLIQPIQGFVRFGNMKGEIRVKKVIYGVIWGVLCRFGNQLPHPPIFEKTFPKNVFFLGTSLIPTPLLDDKIFNAASSITFIMIN